EFPFTSLKYHVLLATAIYFNLKNGFKWHQLYLAENKEPQSEFQVIYRDQCREWAVLPHAGMSRVHPQFHQTWKRRTIKSIGGESQLLESILSRIGSWSAALATIEDASRK
ncbi:MAG: hypothetical protein ACXQS8_05760, partial [Candidatus Helarchaeales archaeon]